MLIIVPPGGCAQTCDPGSWHWWGREQGCVQDLTCISLLSTPTCASVCQSGACSPYVLCVSIKPHFVLSAESPVSPHLSPDLSMAISSRLALWEQKESSTQGSGWSRRADSTLEGQVRCGWPRLPRPASGGGSDIQSSLRCDQSHLPSPPLPRPPRLAAASPTQSMNSLNSSHACPSFPVPQ